MNALVKPLPRYWRPLQRTQEVLPISETLLADAMAYLKCSREEAAAALAHDAESCELWVNDLYQVQVRDCGEGLFHVNIRRRDGAVTLRDWRHFQQIKNEVLGPECEAIELYPAESRLVDQANKFHLWGYRTPDFRFPVGFEKREVSYETGRDPGTTQRPL